MSFVNLEEFKGYFRNLSQFLQVFSWLYETPVTNLLTSNVFSEIPDEWVEHLVNLSNEELNNVPLGLLKDYWPQSLQKFIRDCKRLTLPELANNFPSDSLSYSDDWLESIPKELWKGMSQKKKQEVQMMSLFVHRECKMFGINKIVDLGSGVGYIDRLLLLRGYKILGVESQSKLVSFATTLKDNIFPSKLAKNICYVNINISENSILQVRNSVVNNLIEPAKNPTQNKGNKTKNNFDWEAFMSNSNDTSSDEDCEKVCMIGLHACGDLAVSGLKIYLSLPEVSALVMIPCCYHKMALNCDAEVDSEAGAEKFYNIPLSDALAAVCEGVSFICRPLLRLASQGTNSGWLGWSEADHHQHSFNVLSRAVIELYAQKENSSFKKCFRRLARRTLLKDQNFSNYIDEILNRSELSNEGQVTDLEKEKEKIRSDLLSLWEQHQDKLQLVEVVTALQMCLEPVVESLIVADRMCFLREKNVNVRVIRIIDNKLSPRSLAYVASKHNSQYPLG